MGLLVVFLEAFITVLAQALTLAIAVRALLSWVPLRLPWGLREFLWAVSEPILAPIRRALPFAGGIDFSPLVAIIAIQAVANFLVGHIPPVP